jgi:hypothetical protein
MTIPSYENEIGTLAIRLLASSQTAEQLILYSTDSGTGRVATHVRIYNQKLAEYFATSRRKHDESGT